MKKYNIIEKCPGCGQNKWQEFNRQVDFYGDILIIFECVQCGHIITRTKVFLKKEEVK